MEMLLAGSEGQTLHLTSKAFLRYNSTPKGKSLVHHIRCHYCLQEATVKRCNFNALAKKNRLPYCLGAVRSIQLITTTSRLPPEVVDEESDVYETVRTCSSSELGMVR